MIFAAVYLLCVIYSLFNNAPKKNDTVREMMIIIFRNEFSSTHIHTNKNISGCKKFNDFNCG